MAGGRAWSMIAPIGADVKPLGFGPLVGCRSNRGTGGRRRCCFLRSGWLGIVQGLCIHQPAHQRAKQCKCQKQKGSGKNITSAKRPAAKTSHRSRSWKVIQTHSIANSYRPTRASRWGQRSRKRSRSSVPWQPIYFAEKLRPLSLSELARRHEGRQSRPQPAKSRSASTSFLHSQPELCQGRMASVSTARTYEFSGKSALRSVELEMPMSPVKGSSSSKTRKIAPAKDSAPTNSEIVTTIFARTMSEPC